MFQSVLRRLLGQVERIRADSAAFVEHEANFIRNAFAVEENVRVEQLRFDEHFVDLDKPKELSERKDALKLLYTQSLEHEGFLLSAKLEEFIKSSASKSRICACFHQSWVRLKKYVTIFGCN